MRELHEFELTSVGGGASPAPPKPAKGNNGFGNGSDTPDLAAPGGSAGSPGDKDGSLAR